MCVSMQVELTHYMQICDSFRSEKQKYNESVNALVFETFYFGIMFFSAIWYLAPNPFTAISYFLGALLGSAYCYGLGKYVSTLGGSAYNPEDVKGSGQNNLYLVILLSFRFLR